MFSSFNFTFEENGFRGYMTGMTSIYDSGYKDRKFQFFYSVPTTGIINGHCEWRTANAYKWVNIRNTRRSTIFNFNGHE